MERKKKTQLNPILFGFYFSHSLETTACQPLKTDEKKTADTRTDAADRNGCIRGKGRKHHHSHHRARRWDVYTESCLTGSLGNRRGGCFWPSVGERERASHNNKFWLFCFCIAVVLIQVVVIKLFNSTTKLLQGSTELISVFFTSYLVGPSAQTHTWGIPHCANWIFSRNTLKTKFSFTPWESFFFQRNLN